MAKLWRPALPAHPAVHVVANADDPMVVWAAINTAHVVWFSAGQRWLDDSWVCPQCSSVIHRGSASERGRDWWCTGCPLRRPQPQWVVEDDGVVDPKGDWHLVKLQLPGQVNLGNAATALATAAEFGVRPLEAVPRLATVTSVPGREPQAEA